MTITVKWNDAANEQTYTIAFADITLEAAPVYGAISDASEAGLTASVEGNTLTYTAGTIAYNTDKNGNYVTVSIAKPSWVADASGVKVNDTVVADVAADAVSVSVQVKVSATSDTKVKVQWDSTSDPVEYTIVIGNDVVVEANPDASESYSFVASELTAGTSETSITVGTNDFFTLVGNTSKPVTIDGGTQRVNLKGGVKTNQCSIGITVTGVVTVTMNVKTSAADRLLKVLDSEGATVATSADATPLNEGNNTTISFTLGVEGQTNTYYIGVSTGGMYVYEMSVI